MNLSGKGLTKIPNSAFEENDSVQSINLSKNKLTSLPLTLKAFKQSLSKLVLHTNQFSDFPIVICDLVNLKQLTLQNNKIQTIPKEINRLTNLVNLSLSDNCLTSIPPEIGDLINLETLFLRNNPTLKRIPWEIGGLKNLQWLDISNCGLRKVLPASIGDLTKLQILSIQHNLMDYLPVQLCQCTNLEFIDFEETPLSSIPLKVLKQGTRGIKNYLHAELAKELKNSKRKSFLTQIDTSEHGGGIVYFDYYKDFGPFENIGKSGGGCDGVSKAVLKKLNKEVAIKICGPANKTLFMNELQIMRRLTYHENLVKLLGISSIPGGIADIIVMEYYERDLSIILHGDETRKPQKLSRIIKDKIALGVARGLSFLHGLNPPIIHRDIKPSNILIADDFTPKIIDYGISRERQARLTMSANGTAAYMAPETIEGQPQTEKVDVFSFGILLWEIYTQEIPWDGISDTKILQRVQQSQRPDLRNKNIPDAIKQLIIKCWSQEPTLRPSFKDIEHYLNQYCLQQEKQ